MRNAFAEAGAMLVPRPGDPHGPLTPLLPTPTRVTLMTADLLLVVVSASVHGRSTAGWTAAPGKR